MPGGVGDETRRRVIAWLADFDRPVSARWAAHVLGVSHTTIMKVAQDAGLPSRLARRPGQTRGTGTWVVAHNADALNRDPEFGDPNLPPPRRPRAAKVTPLRDTAPPRPAAGIRPLRVVTELPTGQLLAVDETGRAWLASPYPAARET